MSFWYKLVWNNAGNTEAFSWLWLSSIFCLFSQISLQFSEIRIDLSLPTCNVCGVGHVCTLPQRAFNFGRRMKPDMLLLLGSGSFFFDLSEFWIARGCFRSWVGPGPEWDDQKLYVLNQMWELYCLVKLNGWRYNPGLRVSALHFSLYNTQHAFAIAAIEVDSNGGPVSIIWSRGHSIIFEGNCYELVPAQRKRRGLSGPYCRSTG